MALPSGNEVGAVDPPGPYRGGEEFSEDYVWCFFLSARVS